MKKMIELHKIEKQLAPEQRSDVDKKILVNPDYISLIEPYRFVMPEDISDTNPNAIGDTLTEITLSTSNMDGKSEKIIVLESLEYISKLIKRDNNDFIKFTSGVYLKKEINLRKNCILGFENRKNLESKGSILKTVVIAIINGEKVEYEVNETIFEIKKAMSL